MNLLQSFKIAAKSIAAKKVRSALTMLGIIIGLAAVIILVSFAQGQNKWIEDYYASLVDNSIQFYAYKLNANFEFDSTINDQIYDYCQTPGMKRYIKGVTPSINIDANNVKYGAKVFTGWRDTPRIFLGNDQFSICCGYTIAKGRDIAYLDVTKMNRVCVLGSAAAAMLFDYADPLGEMVYINGTPFTVVGVYAETGAATEYDNKDKMILVPYTLSRTFGNSASFGNFLAVARDSASVNAAISVLGGYLKGLVGSNGNYSVESQSRWVDDSNQQNKMQQMFLGGIAAISLLVGGIGIMNIMLVTVTERTREIGIRKAIGAERKTIIAQFLIEAMLICGIGGVIGIAVGYLGTAIVCQLVLGFISWPQPGITFGAFLFSLAMGVIFGLYPAVKASGLQPVDALRME